MSVEIHVPTNSEIEQMSADQLRRTCWTLMSQFNVVKSALATAENELTKETQNLDQVLSVVRDTLGATVIKL